MQGKRHDRVVEMRLCFFSGKVGDYKVPFKSTRKCRSTVYQKKKKEVEQIRDELGRYVYLKTSIYEDMKQGLLTKEEFLTAKERYAGKIASLETELNEKEAERKEFEACMEGGNRWLRAFLNFRNAKELTREMAVELLEKVEVFEDKRVHIKFRFRNEYEYLTSYLTEGGAKDGGTVSG